MNEIFLLYLADPSVEPEVSNATFEFLRKVLGLHATIMVSVRQYQGSHWTTSDQGVPVMLKSC